MNTGDEQNNPFEPLIDDLESALKTFVAIYNVELIEHRTNQELFKKNAQLSNEQIKQTMEQNIQELYEKAHSLETMFIKNRLEIAQQAPEQLLQEEIQCLKAELKRKEDLLTDTKEKIAQHEQSLRNMLN